jgi:hypothetical protein
MLKLALRKNSSVIMKSRFTTKLIPLKRNYIIDNRTKTILKRHLMEKISEPVTVHTVALSQEESIFIKIKMQEYLDLIHEIGSVTIPLTSENELRISIAIVTIDCIFNLICVFKDIELIWDVLTDIRRTLSQYLIYHGREY